MKITLHHVVTMALLLFLFPALNHAQSPSLGSAANFVLFTSSGTVSNSGTSQVTGNIGTNSGSITGFGNVNGQIHVNDAASAQCAADLMTAYNEMNNATATLFPTPALGNGQILSPGVYSITGDATVTGDLIFDGGIGAGGLFIIKIQGSFTANANSRIVLNNGAQACNIFWKVEGALNMAAGSIMRGTLVAHNGAITVNAGDTLEGRALSTSGNVVVNGVLAFTPLGCGTPMLTGPVAPQLSLTECYALFSANGQVTNTGTTHVTGDVGTNVGTTTGFDPSFVTGLVHPIPDNSTSQCATDLGNIYTYINALPTDIELLYPAQFGHNLVLTPHAYLLNAATTLTDTIYMDAEGNADAVFFIRINGPLSVSNYSKVILINNALAQNIYWQVEGSVNINIFSLFCGTIVCHNDSVTLNPAVLLVGRALATNGKLTTNSMNAYIPVPCSTNGIPSGSQDYNEVFTIAPNPLTPSTTITVNNFSEVSNCELRLFNVLGVEVMHWTLAGQVTRLNAGSLPAGVYFYRITEQNKSVQSGKLISQQ